MIENITIGVAGFVLGGLFVFAYIAHWCVSRMWGK